MGLTKLNYTVIGRVIRSAPCVSSIRDNTDVLTAFSKLTEAYQHLCARSLSTEGSQSITGSLSGKVSRKENAETGSTETEHAVSAVPEVLGQSSEDGSSVDVNGSRQQLKQEVKNVITKNRVYRDRTSSRPWLVGK